MLPIGGACLLGAVVLTACLSGGQAAGGVDQAGIDDIDPMVAAVAALEDEPVLTDNVRDFEKLGVAIVSW